MRHSTRPSVLDVIACALKKKNERQLRCPVCRPPALASVDSGYCACEFKAEDVCLVPEKREELTTEGGLDVAAQIEQVSAACARLAAVGTRVSPFIDASREQIDAVVECGAPCIEIHTGHYADAQGDEQLDLLEKINQAISYAHGKGLQVNAGHGLNRHNVRPIAANPLVSELNIGHSIVADAIFLGLQKSIQDIKQLILEARAQGS